MSDQIQVSFSKARFLLHEGDVLLFRGQGIVSSFIKRAGEGQYSHVGVASRVKDFDGKHMWECVEFREGRGGRSVNLERYVAGNDGIIDVFRPTKVRRYSEFDGTEVREREITFNGRRVTSCMRRMTGLPYGWRRILWIMLHKLPFLRFLYPMGSLVDDSLNDEPIYPVCSTATAHCFASIGWDLTHHRANQYMEPSDVARSAILDYLFTLKMG